MAEAQPRRRWFQFGLGTMFAVVTLFALWLAWELSYIRERQAMRAQLLQSGVLVLLCPGDVTDDPFVPQRSREAAIPIWRRWLGDEAVGYIWAAPGHRALDRTRAKQLFPEAVIDGDSATQP